MPTMQRSQTAERILDVTQALIQRRGFSAVSIRDIAEQVGIKKPSVVHHFPSKEALVAALVKRYREQFGEGLDAFLAEPQTSAREALAFYFTPYLDFGEAGDMICLCGALAGEFTALPADIQREVRLFFDQHQRWLQTILKRGKTQGIFHYKHQDGAIAKHFLDALQGALIIQRATGSENHIAHTIATLLGEIGSQ